MVKFVDYGKGFRRLGREGFRTVKRILTSGQLILRQDLEDFERKLAAYIGTKYAVGVANGTDALFLTLKALGVGPGDEVITSSHTFVATAQVINQLGATPVLCDIREDGLIHAEDVKKLITPRTKMIIPVQLTGDVCNMDEFNALGIPMIEDSCQAIGAEWNGKKAGSLTIAGAFSFYPAKILGCYGDGGAVTTDNEELANELKELRNHYKKDYSKWAVNSRLDNLQAAILNMKLDLLPEYLMKRERVAKFYNESFKNLPVKLPADRKGRVWQDYCLRTEKRDELFEYLKSIGIETMKNDYPFPIPKGPMSLQYEAETLRLPCNPEMTMRHAAEVVRGVKKFYALQSV